MLAALYVYIAIQNRRRVYVRYISSYKKIHFDNDLTLFLNYIVDKDENY